MARAHPHLREKLVAASLELVQERGLGQFSLRKVAATVGVSPGAVYRHFRDKNDLLTAIAEQGVGLLLGWQEHYLARLGGDPLTRYAALGMALVRFAYEQPTHFKLLHMPEYACADRSEVLAQAVQQTQAHTRELLERGAREGVSGDPQAVQLTAQATTYGLARMVADGHLPELQSVQELEALVEIVYTTLGQGLIPR